MLGVCLSKSEVNDVKSPDQRVSADEMNGETNGRLQIWKIEFRRIK